MKINITNLNTIKLIENYNTLYVDRIIKSKYFKKNRTIYMNRVLRTLILKENSPDALKLFDVFYLQKEIWTNLKILRVATNLLKTIISVNYKLYIFDLTKISYTWFERYRVNTPFAVGKNYVESDKEEALLHCLYISIDYDRHSANGKTNYQAREVVIDDEEPLAIHLGKEQNFICKGIYSDYRISDFSKITRVNYIATTNKND